MIVSVNLYNRQRRKRAAQEVEGVAQTLRSIGESQICTAAAT